VLKLNKEHPSWTFKRWMISAIAVLLSISIGNFLFINYLSGWDELSLQSFLPFVLNTVAIGIFPLVAAGYTSLRRTTRTNEELANEIHVHHPPHPQGKITIKNKSGNDMLLELNNILYMEAMQNYVAVYAVQNEGFTKATVRNTLKEVYHALPEGAMFRCHRSFIVNLDHIKHVSGNAQGLLISIEGFPSLQVPVSRKYIPALKELMETV
jgi:DNA-binding LytR/AlgR family response regulator